MPMLDRPMTPERAASSARMIELNRVRGQKAKASSERNLARKQARERDAAEQG